MKFWRDRFERQYLAFISKEQRQYLKNKNKNKGALAHWPILPWSPARLRLLFTETAESGVTPPAVSRERLSSLPATPKRTIAVVLGHRQRTRVLHVSPCRLSSSRRHLHQGHPCGPRTPTHVGRWGSYPPYHVRPCRQSSSCRVSLCHTAVWTAGVQGPHVTCVWNGAGLHASGECPAYTCRARQFLGTSPCALRAQGNQVTSITAPRALAQRLTPSMFPTTTTTPFELHWSLRRPIHSSSISSPREPTSAAQLCRRTASPLEQERAWFFPGCLEIKASCLSSHSLLFFRQIWNHPYFPHTTY